MRPSIPAAALLAVAVAGCSLASGTLRERKAHWEQALSTLPAGAPEAAIRQWAEQNKVAFRFLPQHRQYRAIAERVSSKGIPLPCGGWMIVVEVDVNAAGQAVRKAVSTAGNCV